RPRPAQRLARLPVLAAAGCCIPVSQALLRAGASAAPREITLTSIAGSPYYRLRQGDGRYVVVDAVAGVPGQPVGEQRAMLAARAFVPGAAARYLGPVDEDRWTHAASLNPHRPLHRIQMGDAARTLLYISSSTGEPVMAAPLRQRAWNYVGAWLHWLYMFRDRPADPGWSWIVIGLSGAGVITALTGTLAGLWRWRFGSPYKSGSRSPYREGWLRWHHLSGLVFAAIVCAWIFSGLMSMNPLGIFSPEGQRPDLAAYQ
ncbi:MAG: PepSY domain-containing protein, partial [Pollutimonas bauzanensis]